MPSQHQKNRFYHFLSQECMSKYFVNTFFMYARRIQVQTKVHFEVLQFLGVTYGMGFLHCARDIL